MTSRKLYSEFQDAITDLVLAFRHEPGHSADVDPELLQKGIERALIERDYLDAYLAHLRKLLKTTLLVTRTETEEEMSREEQVEQQIVDHGLKDLPPDRLQRLAVNPVALVALRTAIFDREELPDYWWDKAQKLAEARAPLKTRQQILEAIGIEPPDEDVPFIPQAANQSVLAALGSGPAAGSKSFQPVFRKVKLPLKELTWKVPSEPPVPEDPDDAVLEIILTLLTSEEKRSLEILLAGFMSLTSTSECNCRLRDANKQLLAESSREGNKLVFADLPDVDLSGAILEGEYRQGDTLHFLFRIVLTRKE